jgi:superfamily II DNA or RNA helicase
MTQDSIQVEIIEKALNFYKKERFGFLNIGMRVGKSRISCEILKKLYDYDCTVLLCYPENTLIGNWEREFLKWGYINPNITFCNFSSLWKYKDKMFDFLLIDELHQASDMEIDYCHQIMTNDFQHTKVLGLSGTISKETEGKWGLKEIAKYTLEEAIEDKIIADYAITVHLVYLDNRIRTPNRRGKMLTEKQKYDNFSYVIQQMVYKGANFMHLALSRNRLSLSSIGKMNFLKKLLEQLKDKRVIIFTGLADVADGIGIPSYHSKSENDENLQRFQREEINQLALVEKGKSGLTYKNLDCVILLNFSYNMESSAQSVSRSLMLDYKDKVADLHVISLYESPEIRKVKESLSMLDSSKIKYTYKGLEIYL